MKKDLLRRAIRAPVLALFLSLATATSASASGGILLSVNGKVSITFHRETTPALTGLRIAEGATVKSEGGTATILLSLGTPHVLKPGTSFVIPERGGETAPDPFILRLMDSAREMTARGREAAESGVTSPAGEIVPVHPHNSFVSQGKLFFEWKPAEAALGYQVTLKAPSPVYAYSFTTGPGETKVALPQEAPPLTPGEKYYWKVRSHSGPAEQPSTSPLCWFRLPDKQTEETLQRDGERIKNIEGLDEEERALLTALLFISHGFYHEAEGLLRERLKNHPRDEGIRYLLTGLSRKMKKATTPGL